MRFERRKGISPIIASLLLIAIAVAAGIIVYAFVNGLTGSLTSGGGGQTNERLQMQAFNFAIDPQNGADVCGCSGQVLELFLSNTGSSSTSISAVYFDGALQTLAAGPLTGSGTDVAPATGNAYYNAVSSTLTSSTASGKFGFSAAGTSSELTVPVGGTVQIVIAFSTGATLPTAGSSHDVRVVSSTGATNVFSVTAGRTG